jgi:hypothetical protein
MTQLGNNSPLSILNSQLFMMVRASVQDGHGAIELLYEDEAHHLMGKSHA